MCLCVHPGIDTKDSKCSLTFSPKENSSKILSILRRSVIVEWPSLTMLEYRNILTRDWMNETFRRSTRLRWHSVLSPLFLPSLPTRRLRLFFLFHPSLKANFYVSSNRKSHLCQITVDARVPLEFLLAIPLFFAYSICAPPFSRSSFLQPLQRFRFDKLQYVERSALYVKFSANITKEFPLQRFSVTWNYVTSKPYLAATIRARGMRKSLHEKILPHRPAHGWVTSFLENGQRAKKLASPFLYLD